MYRPIVIALCEVLGHSCMINLKELIVAGSVVALDAIIAGVEEFEQVAVVLCQLEVFDI